VSDRILRHERTETCRSGIWYAFALVPVVSSRCHGITGTTGGIEIVNVSPERIFAGERAAHLHRVSGGIATVGPPPREALLAELGLRRN
jgi:hypothetical protein